MKQSSLLPLVLVLGGLLGAPTRGTAQNPQLPSSAQVQQLLQNPGLAELLRQRIQQSGLSADQIRSRLRAAGYPDTLLNAYFGSAGPGQGAPTPDLMELSAIQALGLPPVAGVGQVPPLDTGMVNATGQAVRAESLAAGNYVFGVDVFRRSKTQFLPLLAGPVPPDYKLGPGDELVLILTGDVQHASTLQVTREGFVLLPQVGQVFVSNLTLDQLREVLFTRLGRVYSGVKRGADATIRFEITVANVRANQVYVIGEVAQPGAYQISALGTVLTALYAAGGVTARANMRHIEVRRLGKTVDTLDLYDYLLRGDSRHDLRLETGDIVFTPVHGMRVQITGAVVRPAIYELRPTEELADVLQAAGGFRPNAARERIAIYRILPPGERPPGTAPRTVVDVALAPTPLAATTAARTPGDLDPTGGVVIPTVTLRDGDSLVVDWVPPLADVYHVGIAGMVQQPGLYPWRPGMTLRDLVLLARGPAVGADLKEEIARLPEDRSQGQLATTLRVPLDSTYLFQRDSLGRYVGPPGLPFSGRGAPEVVLQPYDNVLILKQPEWDFQRTVVISGEVRYPGTYSLRTKTDRLADLITRAGGLTTRAYSEGIRFVRAVEGVGRVNVDLPRAMRDTASSSNIILQPGDSIHIPEYQPSVKVAGAVNSPGSVLWQKGKTLDYYVDAAGGLTFRADASKVRVQYANGAVRTRRRSLLFTSDPRPGPGSVVFVPTKDTLRGPSWVAAAGAMAQILTTTLAIVVLIKQL